MKKAKQKISLKYFYRNKKRLRKTSKCFNYNFDWCIPMMVLLLCIAEITKAQPQMLDKIIAHVGDEIILHSDVENQYQQYLSDAEVALPEDARCTILDKIMLEKLFTEQAKKDSLVVSEDEVDAELERRVRYYINLLGGEEKLEAYYGKSIFELKTDFKEDIYNQLLAQKMESKIYEGLTVTPTEVYRFFDSIPKDSLPYLNSEMELKQIVYYPEASATQKDVAKYLAQKAHDDIVKGADFCTICKLSSDDESTAPNCGDLGWVERGQMVKTFEGAGFKLKEGEMSNVVETEYGYHVIQCVERQGEKLHLRHILKIPKILTADLAHARNALDSLRKQIAAKNISFSDAVKNYSEDEVSKVNGGSMTNNNTGTTYFQADELDDKTLIFALEKMNPGEISPVLPYTDARGKTGFRIVQLVSESAPHVISLKSDYDKIQEACKQAKQNQVLAKWIADKAGNFFISLSDDYKDCKTAQKWIQVSN